MGATTSTAATLATLNSIEFYTSLAIFTCLSYILTLGQAFSIIAVLDPTNYERFVDIFNPRKMQVFNAEQMWYTVDVVFDLSATFFRIYFSAYALYIFTSKFITYTDVDSPFFFYWLDMSSFIIAILALVGYLWRFTEGWVMFTHFFTVLPTQ